VDWKYHLLIIIIVAKNTWCQTATGKFWSKWSAIRQHDSEKNRKIEKSWNLKEYCRMQKMSDSWNSVFFLQIVTLKPQDSIFQAVLRIHLFFWCRSFFNSSDLGSFWEWNIFFSFCLIFCPLDSDPGSQNLADPTNPDPKHWFQGY